MTKRKRSPKAAAQTPPINVANTNAPPLLRSTSSRVLSTLAEVAIPLAKLTHQAATVAAEEAVNGCMVEYLGLLLGVPSAVSNDAFDFSQDDAQHKLATPGKIVVETAKKYGIHLALRVFDAALGFKNLLLRKQASQKDTPANSVPTPSSISSFRSS